MTNDSIQFACESCGAVVAFPHEKAGEIEVCPECFEYVDIPSRAAPKPPLAPAESVAAPAGHTLAFELIDDLPRPKWDAFSDRVFDQLPESQWHNVFCEAARQWLETLGAALPGCYLISESANFLVLSALPAEDAERLLDFCEQSRTTILAHLAGVAADSGYGQHVLLAFADAETYYTYVSHFHGEGEYGGSAGMFLSDTYQHIAVHAVRVSLHRTIAHELTHVCLAHLPLPAWLNEGITQETEDLLLSQSAFEPNAELKHRQKRYWCERGLESFWSGQAFHAADEGQELAYDLARILVRILSVDFPRQFAEFVQTAEASDAGEAAAVSSFGLTLGEVATKYLGEGDWSPRSPIYDSDDGGFLSSRSRLAISASNPRSTGS